MDCCCTCCSDLTRRSWMWSAALASIGAMLGGGLAPQGSTAAAQTAENTSAALEVLKKSISVDVHTHGGTTGITSKAAPNDDFAKGMKAGSLAVACLADVPDAPLLGVGPSGVLAAQRTPQPGELYRYHLQRLDWMDDMVARYGLRRSLTAADLQAAHQAG
jgi:membrane dipeptidase